MNPGRFSVPLLLVLTWCHSGIGADSSGGVPSQPPAPHAPKESVPTDKALPAKRPSLPGVTIVDAMGPNESHPKPTDSTWDVLTDFNATPGPVTDQSARRAQLADLRARIAAGDSTALEELRALLAHPDGDASRGATTSSGKLSAEEIKAKIAELRARAEAGDPSVTITTGPNGEIQRIATSTTTSVRVPDSEQARAMIEDLRARAAAGDPKVKFTTRAKPAPQRTTEMTEEERSRRQAFLASHPDLPERTKAQIAAGLFVLAMKFEDVEQILGPLQPADQHLPTDVVVAPDVKVYTAQESGRTVYVLFRDGKLVRR